MVKENLYQFKICQGSKKKAKTETAYYFRQFTFLKNQLLEHTVTPFPGLEKTYPAQL